MLAAAVAAHGALVSQDVMDLGIMASRAPTADAKEALYMMLIDAAPGTEEAAEAYWALSNLYLDGFSEPREADAVRVLEIFLKRCPESRWAGQAADRIEQLKGQAALPAPPTLD
jgi:hypothetical protein